MQALRQQLTGVASDGSTEDSLWDKYQKGLLESWKMVTASFMYILMKSCH